MNHSKLNCRFIIGFSLAIFAELFAAKAHAWVIPAPVPVSYDASTGEHFTLYAYEGERTVLLLPSTDYRSDLVERAVTQMDWHWAFYVQITGREPTPYRLHNGKPTLAVFETGKLPGAAIGWIGTTGVEFGLGTFKSWYNNLYTAPYDHHLVFAYEFGRNFYFYMGQLDHEDLVMREDWSHIFNFFVYSIGIKKWWALHNFPESDQRWLENSRNYSTMVNYASGYMADSASSFGAFKASKINGAIMTGFLLMLYEQYGDQFSQNFWQEIEKLPAPSSAEEVADKIFVAASRAAQENLQIVFEQQLRFPISTAAKSLVAAFPVRSSLLPLSPAVQQIPVGASNRMLDPDFGFRNVAEWFFLQQYLPPVLPQIDSANPYTGSPALHVAGFNPLPFPDKDNIYFRSYPLIADEAPRIYKFTGWVRASGLQVQDNYPGNHPWMLPILLFDDIIGTIASPDLLAGLKDAATNNGTFGWVRFETYACKRYVSQSNVYVDIRSHNKAGEIWISDISVEVVDVPVIDTHPRLIKDVGDQTVANGDPLTLSFGVGAINQIYYQWFKNGAPINGATMSYYCMPQAGAGDAGQYHCTANTGIYTLRSRTASIVINPSVKAPQIEVQPVGLSVMVGTPVFLGIKASGSSTLRYQWQKDGADIDSATSDHLVIYAVKLTDAGSYSVTVTNDAGNISSVAANLAVTTAAPPLITRQPLSQRAVAGGVTSFSVEATGGQPLNYQWRKNGMNIGGANAASYTITGVQMSDAATYDVVVSNSVAPLTSASTTLVVEPLLIKSFPAGIAVTRFSPFELTVQTTAALALSYQWYKAGILLPGKTQPTLSVASAQYADAGDYHVVVGNSAGNVTSDTARVTVLSLSSASDSDGDGVNDLLEIRDGTNPRDQLSLDLLSRGLTAYYPFNGDASDVSGYANNGIIDGASPTSDRFGRPEKALLFNGLSDKITASHADQIDSLPLTVACWFRTDNAPDTSVSLLSKYVAGSWNGWHLGLGPLGAKPDELVITTLSGWYVESYINTVIGGYGNPIFSVNSGLNDGTWHQAVFTIDPNLGGRLYLDGQMITELSWTGSAQPPTQKYPLVMGYYPGAQPLYVGQSPYFKGAMDEVRIYDRALDQSQVSALYAHETSAPILITTQPVGQSVMVGAAVAMQVASTGEGPFSYQWRKDGYFVDGATASSFALAAAQLNDSGNYTVVITGANGRVVSANATLTVAYPMEVGAQPSATSVMEGNSVRFSFVPAGAAPASYQWLKNGANIVGATSATLILTAVESADAGIYSVVVTDSLGSSMTSNAVTLTVGTLPKISQQPMAQWAASGGSATFSVAAAGSQPLSYQWLKNGNAINGATESSYTINPAAVADSGVYSVVVTNDYSSSSSNSAKLLVYSSISEARQVVSTGGNLSLTIDVPGATAFQWKRDGFPVLGANSSTYTIPQASPIRDNGWYQVSVTFGGNVFDSPVVFVNVAIEPAQIIGWGGNNPQNTNINPTGLNSILAVSAGYVHNLALKSDGTVAAWGANDYGESSVPEGLGSVVAIVGGINTSYALRSDGLVLAWGLNDMGQVSVPVGLSNVVAVSAGLKHCLALRGDGDVVGWGSNEAGQLAIPQGLNSVVAISASGNQSMALKADGSVVTWGGSYPPPFGLSGVSKIACGLYHNLALKSDGAVVAWGYNGSGEATVPLGLSNVVSIAAGWNFSEALKADNTVVAWGYGWNYGTTTVPAGLSNVMGISASGAQSLVLRDASTGPFLAIISQSFSQSVTYGAMAAFYVIATDCAALSYQWYKDGSPIEGATLANYSIEPTLLSSAGNYSVIVTSQSLSVGSSVAALTVSANYLWWQQGRFSDEELADLSKSGPNAVYGQDGLPNLVKYALGLEPKTDATSNLPEVTTISSDWVYSYTRPVDRIDLVYEVEVSTDLTHWTTGGVILNKVTEVNNVATWQAKYPITSTNVYFRLKVTQM